jgi:hypothetical protein
MSKTEEMLRVMRVLNSELVLFVTEVGDDGLNGPIPSVKLEYPDSIKTKTVIAAREQLVELLGRQIPVVSFVQIVEGRWDYALIEKYKAEDGVFVRTKADKKIQNNLDELPRFTARLGANQPTYSTIKEVLRHLYPGQIDVVALLSNK